MGAPRFVMGALTALVALSGSCAAQAASDVGWQLDRVVVVMRHGVRPPTKADPLPGMPHQPFPAWDVGWGELTHHGEKAVALIAAFDRAHYAALLGTTCPAPGRVHAVADTDQRTMRTAQVYVDTLLPGCGAQVEHLAQGAHDPRFSPFEGPTLLSPQAALAAARSGLPRGGEAGLDREIAPLIAKLDVIIACGSAHCGIAAQPTRITAPAGRVKLGGALGMGGSLSETLALEYAEGLPMSQVGWGRVDRDTITQLLALHPGEYKVTARPLPIARVGSRVLLGEVGKALSSPQAPAFSLFVGHDTNIALIGGALGLHWHAPQFAPDDPPPAGALIFERWRNAAGRYRLAVRFRSQSLDEMRNLTPSSPDAMQTLAFTDCQDSCDADGLRRAVTR